MEYKSLYPAFLAILATTFFACGCSDAPPIGTNEIKYAPESIAPQILNTKPSLAVEAIDSESEVNTSISANNSDNLIIANNEMTQADTPSNNTKIENAIDLKLSTLIHPYKIPHHGDYRFHTCEDTPKNHYCSDEFLLAATNSKNKYAIGDAVVVLVPRIDEEGGYDVMLVNGRVLKTTGYRLSAFYDGDVLREVKYAGTKNEGVCLYGELYILSSSETSNYHCLKQNEDLSSSFMFIDSIDADEQFKYRLYDGNPDYKLALDTYNNLSSLK